MSNYSEKLLVTGERRDAEFSIAGLMMGISAIRFTWSRAQLVAGRSDPQKRLLLGAEL
jgi:hypothetical protein